MLAYDKRHLTSDMHWIDYGLGGLRSHALGAVEDSEGICCALSAACAVRLAAPILGD